MTEKWDDEQLEQLMRRGLAARAEQMPANTRIEPTGTTRRWPLVAAAAAAVVAIGVAVPVAVSQLRGDDGPRPADKTVAASPTSIRDASRTRPKPPTGASPA